MDTHFIYVGDAMCSWCWGFAPTLEKIRSNFPIPMRLINGGLRPGPNAQLLDDRMAQFLGHHWDQVSAASGQPFDVSFLERRDGWMYDTELPARAVTTMREQRPDDALPLFFRLQQAFYADGVDITSPEAYPALLESFEVDAEAFVERMTSDEMKWAAWDDFEQARALGVSGFPALLLRVDGRPAVVTRGYAPYDRLEQPLIDFFRGQLGDDRLGEVCSIDGVC